MPTAPAPTPAPTPAWQPPISGIAARIPALSAINGLAAILTGHFFTNTPLGRGLATINHAASGTLGQHGPDAGSNNSSLPSLDFDNLNPPTPGVSWGNVDKSNFDQPFYVNANGSGGRMASGEASGQLLGGVDLPPLGQYDGGNAQSLGNGVTFEPPYTNYSPNVGGTGIRDFGVNNALASGNVPSLNIPDYRPGSPYEYGGPQSYDQLSTVGSDYQPYGDEDFSHPTGFPQDLSFDGAVNGSAQGQAGYQGVDGIASGEAGGTLPSLNIGGQASGSARLGRNPTLPPGPDLSGYTLDAHIANDAKANAFFRAMQDAAGANGWGGFNGQGGYGGFNGLDSFGGSRTGGSPVSNFASASAYYGGGAEGNGGGYVPGMGYPIYEVY